MRTAIISDIHANLEAFEVVLADIRERAIDRIICLGDVIGYGPDPCACIDLVQEHCEFSLLGNHDFACLLEPTNFNPRQSRTARASHESVRSVASSVRRANAQRAVQAELLRRRAAELRSIANNRHVAHGYQRW